ncbi:MAG: NAD(P)H-dependent glycerol-3-phosphate dehydrogenase [Helicobacteraceae bacterium]|jgi:glycerol-3-phosphate dehydrogenase (NAD(P)+)|nr:NAD(P)H-dependent glycerol-3-phosphate dehydrogenase [Helicobacteraceae bacterium]
MKLAVIGAGKWGVALHNALRQVDKDAVITSRKPKNLANFTDEASAIGAEMIVMALSTQSTEGWLKEHFRFNNQAVLVCSKGIETSGGRFLNEIYERFVPRKNLAFLSGPGFAAEVIQNLPTALTIAAADERIAVRFMSCFPKWIKTYRTNDVIGVEVAGAYKNVIAIAAGVCDALNLGSNARAALITRGLAEMTRFGIKFGAKLETFLGLSGVGDLALTATSALSRNYRVGQALGNNEPLNAVLERLGEVAEGVPTAQAIVMLSEKNKLYTPIAKEVVAVLDGKEPLRSLQTLLERTNEKEF